MFAFSIVNRTSDSLKTTARLNCCQRVIKTDVIRITAPTPALHILIATGLFSDSVLNVRKHIFERKHRKSSRNFSSIIIKYRVWSLVVIKV